MRGSPSEIAAALARWRNLEECLLHEVRGVRGFYSAELDFNYVWDSNGSVRQRILDEPVIVRVRLIGIEDFHLVGALTDGMRRSPDAIDWGLSEVAGVQVSAHGPLLRLRVDWESKRSLTVTCTSIQIEEPDRTVT